MKKTAYAVGRFLARAVAWIKPSDRGRPHTPYFRALNEELKRNGPFRPSLLVDLDRLDRNISTLTACIGRRKSYRIVAKSLPSLPLLKYVMEKTGSTRLMVFHQPFLNLIVETLPQAEILLGKPLPVQSAENFYRAFDGEFEFEPSRQLQWLVDTEERLLQYQALAHRLGKKLLINIELDIGLHRGGVTAPADMIRLLEKIFSDPAHLSFSGCMGYDPHVVKVPRMIKPAAVAYRESQDRYREFLNAVTVRYPHIDVERLCLNGAGSPTLELHHSGSVANDLAAGSCLVKPTDFDIPTLRDYLPAAYIATPVLKRMAGTAIPSLERFDRFFSRWNPNREQTFFVYGGKWMARYESPAGLQDNRLYGTSTNQQMVNGSRKTGINVDDHIFLRPSQSEFVFLQFGDILAIRNGKIIESWPALRQ